MDVEPGSAASERGGLKRQAVRGTLWTAAGTAYGTALQFGMYVALYRLLEPADFGLMEWIVAVTTVAAALADAGFSHAIIWRQDLSREQLSSLYWFNAGGGVVLAAGVTATSPLIAWAAGRPEAAFMLAAFAGTLVLAGAGQQFGVLLRRELRFARLAVVTSAAMTAGAVASVGLALAGWGVWSLVLGGIVREAVHLAGLAVGLPAAWRPRRHFRWADLREVVGFGLYQTGSHVVTALRQQLDTFIIGSLVGSATLGCYGAVKKWVLMPLAKLNPVVGQVAFPAFARVQDDDRVLSRGYLTVLQYVAGLSAPFLAVLWALAPLFVEVVFGAQFEAYAELMTALVRVLCLVGLGRALANPVGSLVLAKGRADIGFYVSLAMTGVSAVALGVGVHWEALGVAWAQVGMVLVLLGIGVANARRLVGLSVGAWAKAWAGPVGLSVGAGAAAWAAGGLGLTWGPVERLLFQAAVGLAIYGVLTAVLAPATISRLWSAVRPSSSPVGL